MTPRLLEYEDGRIKITAEAYVISEIKALIDKYDMKAEPYLSYVHSMTALDSQYVNIPENEKSEAIIYDIQATLGDFDYDDPLVANAIEKLRSLYTSSMMLLAVELAEELHRLRIWLKTNPISEENLPMRQSILKDIDKYATAYQKIKDQAEKEMKVATKGDHELGEY